MPDWLLILVVVIVIAAWSISWGVALAWHTYQPPPELTGAFLLVVGLVVRLLSRKDPPDDPSK